MKQSRWRKEQKLRRRRKFIILARLAIVFFFLGLMVWGGVLTLRLFASSKLLGRGRVTIVSATYPISVFSFEPYGPLTVVSIPEETYIEVTRGFGSLRIGAVWKLGEQEKLGGELLKETTQEFLGVPVDGWIGIADSKLKIANSKEEILILKERLTSWKILTKPREIVKFWQSVKTNLTIFDLVRVWWQVKTTRFDKVQFLDLGQTTALSSLILADGTPAKSADQALLDAATQGLFKDTKLAKEHILIEVLNGTDKQGLANQISRLITDLGGSVVSVSNSPQRLDECQIRGEAEVLKSFTGQRLGQVFKCRAFPTKPQDSRADLQIIIGADYWHKLFRR